MKKEYIAPKMEVVELRAKAALLEDSNKDPWYESGGGG